MKLLNKNGEEIKDTIDLGSIFAGDEKEYDFYLYNDSDVEVADISIKFDNKELQVIDYPKRLNPKEKALLRIKWCSNLNIKKGLKAQIKIEGFEIYRP